MEGEAHQPMPGHGAAEKRERRNPKPLPDRPVAGRTTGSAPHSNGGPACQNENNSSDRQRIFSHKNGNIQAYFLPAPESRS